MVAGLPRYRRLTLLCAAGMSALFVTPPARLLAQGCAAGTLNSCMTVGFTAGKPSPDGADFANGVAVLGSFTLSVLKCGRMPCEITMAAGNQPPSGLRVRVGSAPPTTLADCPIDLTGVNSAQSSRAPVVGLASGPTTFTVWVCSPLSWNPAVTPLGTSSPDIRFRLRQS